jgi:putative ABC transport system permease protein
MRYRCRPARWIHRLLGDPHGAALATEVDNEYIDRRRIPGRLRRRLALWALWAELSPQLLHFAVERARARRRRAPRRGGIMDSFAYMLLTAARSLRRRPAFTALVAITLALGIGANTAIFSVVNGVLLQPLPYPEAHSLVMAWVAPDGPDDVPGYMSYPDITDLREGSPSIERLAGVSASTTTLTGMGDPTLLTVARVSDGLLEIFGLAPALGRDLRAEEYGADAAAVVVISHAFWQQHFGDSDAVLGQSLTLNGRSYEVVGVAPQGFDYPEATEVWIPRSLPDSCARSCHTWHAIGRLAPGATLAAAQSEADAIAANLSQAYPSSNLDKTFLLRTLRDQMVGNVRTGLWLLLGAVGAVLLIACANVANLMLARAASRRAEVSLRAALGATPRQLVGVLLLESLMLALLGAAAGLALAYGGIGLLQRLAAGAVPRLEMIRIDGTVLLFTLGLAVLVALVFGASPARRLGRLSLSAALGSAGRGSDMAAGSRRLRGALTAVEMCVSVVLLVGAGLLLRTFVQLYAVDPGFETHNIVRFSLSLPAARYGELEQQRTTFREIERDIAALPGVEAAGSVYGAPMDWASTAGDVIIEGAEPPPPGRENGAAIRPMGPGYLETMRIPLVAGRLLEPADDTSGRAVALVNEAFVRENFPDRDPLGERVRITVDMGFGSPFWTIVGVVGDVHSSGLTRAPRAEVYVPHGQFGSNYLTISVRARGNPDGLIDALRARVHAVDPDLPLQRIETIDDVVERAVAPTRFFLVGVATFAAVAMLLAVVGLYGVVAYLASQRTREIGVRIALGASTRNIVRMMMADGLRPAALGLLAGVALSVVAGRLVDSLLFGIARHDPLTLATVPALLAGVAILAVAVPAVRAARVDPLHSLRRE